MAATQVSHAIVVKSISVCKLHGKLSDVNTLSMLEEYAGLDKANKPVTSYMAELYYRAHVFKKAGNADLAAELLRLHKWAEDATGLTRGKTETGRTGTMYFTAEETARNKALRAERKARKNEENE